MIYLVIIVPVIFALIALFIYIIKGNSVRYVDNSSNRVIIPSKEIKKRLVNKHVLRNGAPRHNNNKVHSTYCSFVKNSQLMEKVKNMKESQSRYNG